MIETNKTGQRQLDELYKTRDTSIWNDWELDFIRSVCRNSYEDLSAKQKAAVTKLWSKLWQEE